MEESLYRQFKGDKHMGMLTIRQGALLQIKLLTGKGLQVKQGWLSVTTVKRKEIPSPAAFQTDDLDAFDSNCDDTPSAKAILMANLSSFDSSVLSKETDQIAKIMGYGDYQLGNVTILRVYYVEGLRHNLFSVGHFCDSVLEVTFQKHTCYVLNLDGDDLLFGSRDPNLYTISLDDMLKSSLICLLSKASKTKSWLWHRRLSYLNFGTLNQLAKQGLVRGLQKLKFEKDHLCSSCSLEKSKKSSHKPKADDTNQEKLYLCIWIFAGQCESKNGIVKRQNYTLAEVARTMLIFSKAPMYLWVEAVSTTCYTKNHSLIRLRYNKTPYELMHQKKHDLSFLYVFGSLCYPTNEIKNLGKLKLKVDIGLVPNPIPQPPYVPPTKNDWDIFFQPMFDESLNPPLSVVSLIYVVAAPRPVDPIGSHVLTSIDQDAPSSSNPSTQELSLIISQGFVDQDKPNHVYRLKKALYGLKQAPCTIIKQDKAQQVALDEKLVPTEDRVKIGKSNLKMDPTLTQKEETYQVILEIIKNTLCYNAFLITTDVPVFYMQQFWYTIKRVKKSSFYEFDIDNKTCQIEVELFRKILDIFPRV
uniref:Integrase, catalytic region, zinc finger, CCHC-type, peptidase aspartic, catalytic n=1 Tax=Tanacetum cinerariifolium TaxID=118510 RepID=A0A6L2K811_TANCI|nr:integrase, catalytic region, zinc finger, CCHC-type, peptidase aspartic, catalytic [Tanacetum cinerariifolium]